MKLKDERQRLSGFTWLITWIFFSMLYCSFALGQTKPNKPAKSRQQSTLKMPSLIVKSPVPKHDFLSRLRISYFSALSTPTYADMKRGKWDQAATSPEFGGKSNRDSAPLNTWNQLSFNYQYSPKMGFIINPRWTNMLAHPVARKHPEDRALFSLEDFLVGFQGVVASSEDKKFNLWIRPGVLLPTSRNSRYSTNRGFGNLVNAPEISYIPSYDLSKNLQLGVFGIIRMWIYEDRYNSSRLRYYTAPYIRYALDDNTRIQVYYEHMLENNRRWKDINGKKPVYKDVWQNVMVGINQDIGKLNIYPFIGAFINDRPFSDESIWSGVWISYQIK